MYEKQTDKGVEVQKVAMAMKVEVSKVWAMELGEYYGSISVLNKIVNESEKEK